MDGATPDTSGKVALVTGSTDGIGRETALGLARQGATVLVHGRDREKGRALTDRIERETDGSAALLLADFADREAVEELVAAIAERYDRLDVLVHNAGATFQERGEIDAGIERTFAINHLAPFLLTHRLLSLLDASAHARIITTSSGLHLLGAPPTGDDRLRGPQDERGIRRAGSLWPLEASERLFTYELARRLDPASITANAFGLGFVPGTRLNREASRRFRLATGALGRLPDTLLSALPGPVNTIEEGARSQIYLATDPEVKYVSGHHFENRSPVLSAPESYDPHTARRLWEVSAEMVDLPVADRSIGRDGSDPSRLLDRATRALGRS